jgi:hypothetical protein
MSSNSVSSVARIFNGWEVLRDATADEVRQMPPPAAGRYVIALDPPTLDGIAEHQGVRRYVPRREHLALQWTNTRGVEVLHQLDGLGCLLWGCRVDATWLPEGWAMDVLPAGWTLAHLEAWFGYALGMARGDEFNNTRGGIPLDWDISPAYAPTPRGLVTHAHLIVRHLGLPDSPTEPHVVMDRAGCQAELRGVRDFFRRAMGRDMPMTLHSAVDALTAFARRFAGTQLSEQDVADLRRLDEVAFRLIEQAGLTVTDVPPPPGVGYGYFGRTKIPSYTPGRTLHPTEAWFRMMEGFKQADTAQASGARLTDRQRLILTTMLDMGAVSRDTKRKQRIIVQRINRNHDPDNYKHDFQVLRNRRLTDAERRGPDSGNWLTPEGANEARQILNPPAE